MVDVAKFAVGLHDDATQVSSLNRTILNAYVALGDLSRIKHAGEESLVTAKQGSGMKNIRPMPRSSA